MEWTKQTQRGLQRPPEDARVWGDAPSAGRPSATKQRAQENATHVPRGQTDVLLHTAGHTGLLPTPNRAQFCAPLRFISRLNISKTP